MMKILLDTNIILDSFWCDRPLHEEALSLFEEEQFGTLDICASSLSLKDVYYIGCKELDERLVRSFISGLLEVMKILPVDQDTIQLAIKGDEADFEDGIVRACAETAGVDFIITRDVEAFANSTIKSIASDDFCKYVLK